MSKVTYGRGYVYSIKYHIVWCTKYRHRALQGKIDHRLKEIIKEIAYWNPSYFVATVSENTEEQIREYIKKQKTK